MIDNFALYMWYLVPALIGAMLNKENRLKGALIGIGIAFVGITLLALKMGG